MLAKCVWWVSVGNGIDRGLGVCCGSGSRSREGRAGENILRSFAGEAGVATAADAGFGAIDGAALRASFDHRHVLRCGRFPRRGRRMRGF